MFGNISLMERTQKREKNEDQFSYKKHLKVNVTHVCSNYLKVDFNDGYSGCS